MTKAEKQVAKWERKVDKRRKRLARAEVRLGEARQMVRQQAGPNV